MPGARYAGEKLVGFGILYLVVALAFLPSEIWRSSPIEGIWEVLTGSVAVLMTVISIELLEVNSQLNGRY